MKSSDSRLRQLHRRWQESQLVQDEIAYRTEQLRQAEICPAQVEVAALGGSQAALALSGMSALPESQFQVLDGLSRLDRRALEVAGVLGVLLGLPHFETRFPDDGRPRRVLEFLTDLEACRELVRFPANPPSSSVSDRILFAVFRASNMLRDATTEAAPLSLVVAAHREMQALIPDLLLIVQRHLRQAFDPVWWEQFSTVTGLSH